MKNRLPHSAIRCSPYKKLAGQKPSLKRVKVFGCEAFVYDENSKSKFHSTGRPGIFLGCNDHGVYTIELLSDRCAVNSVHATFDESNFPALENMDPLSSSGEDEDMWKNDKKSKNDSDDSSGESSSDEDAFPSNFNLPPVGSCNSTSNEDESSDSENENQPRRSNRKSKKPDYYGKRSTCRNHTAKLIRISKTTSNEPTVYEALNATPAEVKLWNKAISDELATLED